MGHFRIKKASSHANICSLKKATEEEWNKVSGKFILKACKSFWWHVDTIIEKKMAAILSKFIVLCLFSYFLCYLLKQKLFLFYNRVVYFYTRIFLILLPHPVHTQKMRMSFSLYIYMNKNT